MWNLNWEVLFPILFYMVLLYAIAVWANRATAQGRKGFLSEYFLGGRTLGGVLLALTLVTTYTSGSSFIGGPGLAYKLGLGWVLLAMIQVPTAVLTLGVLGKKFAILGRRLDAITVNDFLRHRYESKSLVILSSISLLLFLLAAMVAQFVAGARLLESVTRLPYVVALFLFAGTVVLYTTVGGFRAVALTDAVQGLFMVLGTAILIATLVHAGGGMEHITKSLLAIDPSLVTPFGPNHFLSEPFMLSFWVLIGLGVVGIPFTAVKCMTYRDTKALHKGIVLSTWVLFLLMLGMHLSGALGRAILPDLQEVDRIIPELSLKLMPPAVAGVFLAGPLAAIMSTVDSQLILASATIVKDLYLNYIHPEAETSAQGVRTLGRIGFVTTGVIGLLAVFVAIEPPSLVAWINLFAFGGLEAAFLLPVVLGLYWKRANAAGALASMLTGILSYIALQQFWGRIFGMHVVVPTIVMALVVFVLTSLLTRAPDQRVLRKFWGKGCEGFERVE